MVLKKVRDDCACNGGTERKARVFMEFEEGWNVRDPLEIGSKLAGGGGANAAQLLGRVRVVTGGGASGSGSESDRREEDSEAATTWATAVLPR